MAYAVYGDVQKLLAAADITFGSTTGAPPTALVESWCVQWSAVLDGVLNRLGYGTVPATDSDDVNFLLPYVAERVAVAVWDKVYPNATDQPEHVDMWRKDWEWLMDNLLNRKIGLPSQQPGSSLTIAIPKVYGLDS